MALELDFDINEMYVVVRWPEIQHFMDHPDFGCDCFLINDDHGIETFGSSAYFVPIHIYQSIEIKNNEPG